jgi:hypothetical protein
MRGAGSTSRTTSKDTRADMLCCTPCSLGILATMRRILDILREERPTGDDWHKALIARLAKPLTGEHARPALLSHEVATDLYETLGFRHRAMHSYGDFNASKATPAIKAAARLKDSLPAAVASFRETVDPPPRKDNSGIDGQWIPGMSIGAEGRRSRDLLSPVAALLSGSLLREQRQSCGGANLASAICTARGCEVTRQNGRLRSRRICCSRAGGH